jgi:hypothetical protein
MTTVTADERDEALVDARMAMLDRIRGPRVGDYVRFADGTERRISYHWRSSPSRKDEGCTCEVGDAVEYHGHRDHCPAEPWDGGCQTSDGGSFYLGDGYVSMSGSLYPCVPTSSLVLTEETKHGSVWIFHHDHACAHNGVHFEREFRVYTCDQEAPR